MGKFVAGRHTAEMEGPFVVFVIGLHINNWLAVHQWLPIIQAMNRMLRELYQNRELGFLDAAFFWGGRGPVMIQYWRSYDQLEQYARGSAAHLNAWRDFNKKAARMGKVGFFHETYLVEDGRYECMYVNMPVYGLAKAGKHVPAVGARETARRRLGGQNEPAVPTPDAF
ncbi:DUF4188 domain-containing protein [Brevibacillus composti]|uniref:DUF4188 domain-containing protein n=1 Tax=Brevibacillus composti TaxID=2796470 RepID=A0A7T5EMY2_9BACL|nr:DUF4188 domain-containing protein [Brevibacillus composti]QQE75533.1 DUF4188 domain-containing protein [Brevibacillus composti]QUO42559.1 DUF4188 domain-containing protein [Brevibacillus composti]